jgi:pimeloyl-ACP methyl ester carboxylesterase
MFKNNPNAEAAMTAHDKAACSARLDAFASAEPKARVVRLPNADHFLFESNGDEVIKAIREFLATLP